jgi:hypothetical protein
MEIVPRREPDHAAGIAQVLIAVDQVDLPHRGQPAAMCQRSSNDAACSTFIIRPIRNRERCEIDE